MTRHPVPGPLPPTGRLPRLNPVALAILALVAFGLGFASARTAHDPHDGSHGAPGAVTMGTARPRPDDPDSGVELIGRPAPAWRFDRWARGGPLKLADLRGRVVLVRFWTEQCRFCETTLPAIEQLRTRHANDGLVVVAAYHPNKLGEKRSDARILASADSLGFGGPVACDEQWRTLERWWLDGHPDRNWVSASFLIDREGVIRWVHGGGEYHASEDPKHARCEVKLRELERALEQTLAQGRTVDAPIGRGAGR